MYYGQSVTKGLHGNSYVSILRNHKQSSSVNLRLQLASSLRYNFSKCITKSSLCDQVLQAPEMTLTLCSAAEEKAGVNPICHESTGVCPFGIMSVLLG